MRRKAIAFGLVLILTLMSLTVLGSMTVGQGGTSRGFGDTDNTCAANMYWFIETDYSSVPPATLWSYPTGYSGWVTYWGGHDIEILDNGNRLITHSPWPISSTGYVREVDQFGTIVWQYAPRGNSFCDAERLPNGNTLICDMGTSDPPTNTGRIIEVNPAGTIVWQLTGFGWITDVERLANGNTLVTDAGFGFYPMGIYEFDVWGNMVWKYTNVYYPFDAERLSNGNTLIANSWNMELKEVDPMGTMVWQFYNYLWWYPWVPNDVERLSNGNTLVADTGNFCFYEIDPSGFVWGPWYWTYPTDVERIDIAFIPALVRHEPQSLNLDSNGNWVQFKVEGFPDNPEYTPDDVDGTTCGVNGVNADLKFGTYNDNKYIGKADRLMVEDTCGAPDQETEMEISGQLNDGTPFKGRDRKSVV